MRQRKVSCMECGKLLGVTGHAIRLFVWCVECDLTKQHLSFLEGEE